MFCRFFIDRPIFASVLSIVVTLAGGVALFRLPVTLYPDITPPTVEVSASYPGANAKVVADTVAAPIEQQVNGVEEMMYMASQSANDGSYALTVTFRPGTDLNLAQVLVQNRVNLAEPVLPAEVTRRGVSVKKKSPTVLMIVNLFSPDGSRDNLYLSNYATIQLRDELARVPGVGDIVFLGKRDYSMRVWLDPGKMAERGLSARDVIHAVQQQNVQVAAGQIGQPPVPAGQVFQLTMTTLGRLSDPEQFEDMVLRTDAEGRLTRLEDVAEVELGAQTYDQVCTLDGKASVALSVYQLPGSNALETARRIRERMGELRGRFPSGMDYSIVYDTTPFIQESVTEVRDTLRDAVLLVAAVMLLFLRSWRSALIPLVAVPVAVVGTFAAMVACGFSINNLTLFGLVLAIGIVVDDAIVVVEAVERHIEGGAEPPEAAIKAMDEVAGPVIAIGLVLSAVFLPCAFISGITGQFFRQFALTIAISTAISAFNSLTLSPALAALLLKSRHQGGAEALPWFAFPAVGGWLGYEYLTDGVPPLAAHLPPALQPFAPALAVAAAVLAGVLAGAVAGLLLGRLVNRLLGWAFDAFHWVFDRVTGGYVRAVGWSLYASPAVLALYGGLLYLTWHVFTGTPTGFIPTQDKGYLLVNVQLPDSASLARTGDVMKRAEDAARAIPGVKHTVTVAGQSILLGANAPNFASMYVMLDDFERRREPDRSGDAVADKLEEVLAAETGDGIVNVFGAPPVEGLGTAGGFKLVLEDRGDLGPDALQEVSRRVVQDAGGDARLRGVFTSYRADTPWLEVAIDRTSATKMGVHMDEVFEALQVYFGSSYVNDFNRFGRTWQVNVQALPDFRRKVEDLKRLKVRNDHGGMVPLSAFASVRDTAGPVVVYRYNLYPAAPVNGTPGPGVSSGEALTLVKTLADDGLPPAMKAEWTELALLQLQAGNTALVAFVLAVVFVFLVLAAQYESWALPLAVILVVPMCLLCSAVGVNAARLDVNIFTQVGFVVLVGLACKNAILIVEFAKQRHDAGASLREATLEACRLRLRPIVMTSFAFIIGVVPLLTAAGAGAEMRRALGTAMFAGMLGVTLFGVFLTPVFFFVIQWLVDLRGRFRRAA